MSSPLNEFQLAGISRRIIKSENRGGLQFGSKKTTVIKLIIQVFNAELRTVEGKTGRYTKGKEAPGTL